MMNIGVAYKGQSYTIPVEEETTIGQVKEWLHGETGIEAHHQKLLFKGVLRDDYTINDYKIDNKSRIILMGTPAQNITQVQSAQAQPTKFEKDEQETPWEDEERHKKIIKMGAVANAMPGNNGVWALPDSGSITNLRNQFGNQCRMVFEFDCIRLSTNQGSTHIPYDVIRDVSWQKLSRFPGYGILHFNTDGKNVSKNLFLYFVPLQYMESIKLHVLMKNII